MPVDLLPKPCRKLCTVGKVCVYTQTRGPDCPNCALISFPICVTKKDNCAKCLSPPCDLKCKTGYTCVFDDTCRNCLSTQSCVKVPYLASTDGSRWSK
ncbi:hypothetical protein HK098_005141 [Nowakowskiella sp. JEL0407]|nr:hypothetical protein HK098_005141 [Nowakowskiella sp. JEL0407]